jgi:hypothetical protein
LSRLEDRVISFPERDGDLAPPDRKTLRELNLSARELRKRHADFSTSLDGFSAGKPSEAIAGLFAMSSTSRFGVSKPSQ